MTLTDRTAEHFEPWVRARDALFVQARVVGALVLRETRSRFGKSQLGYFWAVAEPLGQVIVLALIFSLISRHPPYGSDMMLFFATGVLPFTLFNSLSRTLLNAFDANEALLTIPIVQPIDTLLARAILEVATILMVMILIFTGLTYFRSTPLPQDMSKLALAITGLVLAGFGMGTINAVVAKSLPSWRNIYDILTRPLMIVSGVFFLPEAMPRAVRDIICYLPTLQGIELFRSGYFTGYRSSVLDPGYLITVGLVLTLVGLAAERLRRVRSE